MAGGVGRNRNGFGAVEEAAKGRLWSRGISLAEAVIEGGLEPGGRWRSAGFGEPSAGGVGARTAWEGEAARSAEADAALIAEPGFATVAA